jgi:hypothetical protein
MEYWGVGVCLRKRVRREQVLSAGDPTARRARPFGPRKKAFSGTCRCPHRKVALAQCRIGFQPVSPDHRTTRRESGLFAPWYWESLSIKRGEINWKGSLEAEKRQAGSLSYIAPLRYRGRTDRAPFSVSDALFPLRPSSRSA